MTSNEWENLIKTFMFLVAAFAGFWKAVDAVVGYFSKRREKGLQKRVDQIEEQAKKIEADLKKLEDQNRKLEQEYRELSEEHGELTQRTETNKEIIQILKQDLAALMMLLIDKNYKK